ncbi:SDR family oxidoreductase [candidate division KSB1 bacterium]|nr:SDR family oxidoreductase [candidate division KSB1 bacterium]
MSYVEELFSLQDKVAVVIGGGGVLAGAMAEGFARAGADIAILDLTLEKAQKKAEEISRLGVKTLPLQADAAKQQDLIMAEKAVKDTFGRYDILVNAPGINSATPFFEIPEDEWDKILQVNLKSMFLACQIFGKRMVSQGGGSIINISSVSSGPPLSKVFTYSISKAGVNNLTQFLAREWAKHKVRVNAIAPGFFPAEQNRKILSPERIADIMRHTPMDRFGEAGELVAAAIWLASEQASSFVTGAIIRVDGGYTAMTI